MKSVQRGFSLIEIMVVVVILGILAALVVTKIMNRPDEARKVKAKQDVMAIQNALELYKLDNGNYPSQEQGLQALVSKPTTSPAPQNWNAYLKSLPRDPWGNPYDYLNPGQHGDVDVSTNGPGDHAEGEDSAGGLIGNWDPN